ncbi:hypothetical protein ACP4OV_025561 [Aristida adscensionis]
MEGGDFQLPSAAPSDGAAAAVDLDAFLLGDDLDQLLAATGDGSFPEVVSRSPHWLASPRSVAAFFAADATSSAPTAAASAGCWIPTGFASPSPFDWGLLEQPLPGDDIDRFEAASTSPAANSLQASPPPAAFFAADASRTPTSTTPPANSLQASPPPAVVFSAAATRTPTVRTDRRWTRTGGASPSARERFGLAMSYIEETKRDGDVLMQPWVPFKDDEDGRMKLLTFGLGVTKENYDSHMIWTWIFSSYQFFTDFAPGRSAGREWLQNLRYLTSYEERLMRHGWNYLAVYGKTVLPVFERGSYSCLGVIELIVPGQNPDLTSEINTICSALQAVNLTTTEVPSIQRIKLTSASYRDALQEILVVLTAACVIHNLPLAQTWVTCAQQGKWGSRHSDENYRYCISTFDEACYVNEAQMQGFHEACSEHHLLRGQGVAGKAFTTNQPCFLPDIGSSTELDYPLSHHAKNFNLKGAVAIRLRSTRTGNADCVLEFFLPTDCEALEEQKALLDSLFGTMQSVCRTLRMVTNKEMEDEAFLGMNEAILEMQEEEMAGEANLQQQQQASISVNPPKSRNSVSFKKKSRKSEVWKHFKIVSPERADVVEAECFHCHKKLKANSKNGTSTLLRHLKSHASNRTEVSNSLSNSEKNKDGQVALRNYEASAASTQDAAQGSRDHVREEIAALMDLVVEAGAEEGSDEHYYATQLLIKKEYRDVFFTLKTPKGRLGWLRRMWEDRKKN